MGSSMPWRFRPERVQALQPAENSSPVKSHEFQILVSVAIVQQTLL